MKLNRIYRPFIYHIRHDQLDIKIGSGNWPPAFLKHLLEHDTLIIWERGGLFRLFPPEVLYNIHLSYERFIQVKKEYPRYNPPKSLTAINWNQGIPVSPEIVKVLLSVPDNSCNGPSDSDATADPTSKDKTIDP